MPVTVRNKCAGFRPESETSVNLASSVATKSTTFSCCGWQPRMPMQIAAGRKNRIPNFPKSGLIVACPKKQQTWMAFLVVVASWTAHPGPAFKLSLRSGGLPFILWMPGYSLMQQQSCLFSVSMTLRIRSELVKAAQVAGGVLLVQISSRLRFKCSAWRARLESWNELPISRGISGPLPSGTSLSRFV